MMVCCSLFIVCGLFLWMKWLIRLELNVLIVVLLLVWLVSSILLMYGLLSWW